MAIERREFLGALALAPAALAACAGASAAGRSPPASPGEGKAAAPSAPAADGALAAVRSFPLAADVEPALVFRAAVARSGER